MRPVVDMMIASFMYVAMDQIVSMIAKSTYMYGDQAKMPITIGVALFYGVPWSQITATVPGHVHDDPRPQDRRFVDAVRREGGEYGDP